MLRWRKQDAVGSATVGTHRSAAQSRAWARKRRHAASHARDAMRAPGRTIGTASAPSAPRWDDTNTVLSERYLKILGRLTTTRLPGAPRADLAIAPRGVPAAANRRDLALSQHRRDVYPLHRLAVLPIGLARALDRDPLPQPVGDLVDREDLHHRLDRLARRLLGLDAPEGLLGLRARQAVRSPRVRIGPSWRFRRRPSACASARSTRPTSRRSGRLRTDASCPPIAVARKNWTPNWTPGVRKRVDPGTQKGPALQGLSEIGETGFEPATARPPAGCATRLRHSPWCRRPKRATGIEPALRAWKAPVQPQHFARGRTPARMISAVGR